MIKRKKSIRHILIIFLFAIALFGFRYAWLQYFSHSHQIEVENGEVFITGEKASEEQLQLVGDWTFYPNELLEELPERESSNGLSVDVPGAWSDVLENESIYGYGTYHLRIHIDSYEQQSYALRMYSVRSTSKVFSNGVYI